MAGAVEVTGLRKSYRGVEAVRGIDLSVSSGEVFALLGPNGAGKTSTVEILEGHRLRDGGDVNVLGFDPATGGTSYRERIGIVLQETSVERYLTVAEAIEMVRGYYPRPRPLDDIIEVVGLTQKRTERVIKLSGGQQRRLDVAIGLAGDPELLFLDEPTTGFDPTARRNAWQMIKNLKELGKTVFLTTHYMDEAQSLADRVAIIVAGQIVAEGPPETLAARDERTRVRFALPEGAPALPKNLHEDAVVSGEGYEIVTHDPTALLNELTGWAVGERISLERLSVSRATLEDVYLQLTGDAEVVS